MYIELDWFWIFIVFTFALVLWLECDGICFFFGFSVNSIYTGQNELNSFVRTRKAAKWEEKKSITFIEMKIKSTSKPSTINVSQFHFLFQLVSFFILFFFLFHFSCFCVCVSPIALIGCYLFLLFFLLLRLWVQILLLFSLFLVLFHLERFCSKII